jgi:hypothetical protein
MPSERRGQGGQAGAIHFAADVESPTACGKIGPASRDWKFVDCFVCLAKKHEPRGQQARVVDGAAADRSSR